MHKKWDIELDPNDLASPSQAITGDDMLFISLRLLLIYKLQVCQVFTQTGPNWYQIWQIWDFFNIKEFYAVVLKSFKLSKFV